MDVVPDIAEAGQLPPGYHVCRLMPSSGSVSAPPAPRLSALKPAAAMAARVSQAAQAVVQLRGASSAFRRHWQPSGFGEAAPMVQLVA